MATIKILGDIGASVQAEDVIEQILAVKDDHIKVLIASPGGSAFQGLMVHDALKASGKEITTVILGLGASAASVIFMAGDKREMGDSALLMVHNSRVGFEGTAAQMREQLETMDAIDERMKSVLIGTSGISDEAATDLLSKDSFMNLETAIDLGLATGSIQDDIAASLNVELITQKKEPIEMAIEEETKKLGFMDFIKAWVGSEAKAEAEKAEGDDEEKKEPKEEEAAFGDDEKKDDEEKAAADDEDKEKEEMKAKIESLQAELADTKAKAEGDDEEKKKEEEAKVSAILTGITDKKVTMCEAIKLSKKPPSEVSAHLDGLLANATGRGKTEEPNADASSKLDQWKAMKEEKLPLRHVYRKTYLLMT